MHSLPAPRASAGLTDLTSEDEAGAYYPNNTELASLGLTRAQWNALSPSEKLRRARGGSSGGGASGGASGRTSQASAAMLEELGLSQADWNGMSTAERREAATQWADRNARSESERNEMIQGFVSQGLDALGNYLDGERRERLAQLHEDAETLRERLRGANAAEVARINAEIERMRTESALELARLNHFNDEGDDSDQGGDNGAKGDEKKPTEPTWVKPALVVGGAAAAVGLVVLLVKSMAPPPPPPLPPYAYPPGYPGVR